MSRTHIPVALRRLVYQRAGGCCEYCQIPDQFSFHSHQIDHVIPEKHGGHTDVANCALACILCNQHKGSDLASIDPLTQQITPLFNPRQQHWAEHFALAEDGALVALTPTGRATIQLLQLNLLERLEERKLLREAGFWND